MNYLDLTIAEIHKAILEEKVTPLELVQEALKRAKENHDNAFETIVENAVEKAKNLDTNKKNNLFYGIPIVIKDNFSTKGIETTASSNILNGYIPIFSAEVVNRLEEQGAIIIGKTTLDELAMGGSGTTGHKGTTFNPWDNTHQHLIGGSSCGSAAAVAAQIVPFGLGSDTGDSVRKPASHGGLVGFKPTWGRISRYGLSSFATSLDHVGYFTRSVFDAAIALNVLAGRDDKDASSSFEKVEDYSNCLSSSIKGKKIAVITNILKSITNPDIISSFDKTLSYLKEEGAIINEIKMDENILKAIYPTYIIISCAEATSNNANLDGIKFGPRYKGETYEDVIFKARTNGFSELIKRRFVIGSYCLFSENQHDLFLRAQKARRIIVEAFNNIFLENDAIYIPAAPSPAPLIKNNKEELSTDYVVADNVLAFGNFGGYPSITLPIGFSAHLPFGGNITGKPFAESLILNIAYKIEQHTGFYNLNPKENK